MNSLFIFVLYLIFGINLVFFSVILLKKKWYTVDVVFALSNVFSALYAVSIVGLYFSMTFPVDIDWLKIKHVSGFSLSVAVMYVGFLFPKRIIPNLKNVYLLVWAIPFLLLSGVVLFSDAIGSSMSGVPVLGAWYPMYIAGTISYEILGFVFISLQYYRVLKNNLLDKALRARVSHLLFGSVPLVFVATLTNIILPYFGVFDYFWVGGFSILLLIALVFFVVFRYTHLPDLKVVVTEFFSILIVIVLLYEIFASETTGEFYIGVAVTILTSLFLFLLIRSVYEEVSTREEVEDLVLNLRIANDKLRELDQQKSEFVSMASHQLRSPLTAIRGYTSLILEGSFGKLNIGARASVEKIYHASNSLVNIVEDFLNVSRIEQHRMKYISADFDLKDLIVSVTKELSPNIEHKQLKFIFETPGKRKNIYTVNGDKEKIRLVIIDVLENSIKYTLKGHIKIVLKESEDRKKLVLEISDTGIGLSQKTRRELFQKFNRGDEGVKTQADGSGIGLFIAREILKAHHGSITAQSEGRGKGAKFTIEIPRITDIA